MPVLIALEGISRYVCSVMLVISTYIDIIDDAPFVRVAGFSAFETEYSEYDVCKQLSNVPWVVDT